MILDRVNILLSRIGHQRVSSLFIYPSHSPHTSMTPAHDTLDIVDRHAGIITRFRLDRTLAPVGERVRRLERHLDAHTLPAYFWLGASLAHEEHLTQ